MTKQRTRLTLEALEDRCTPSASGLAWPDPQHLTLSFAPDGTDLLGVSSQLFTLLNDIAPTKEWQTEILRAFQTWAIWGNVNIGLVDDSGLAFGSAGAPQGDDRFGDIRIGTFPLSSEVIAVASGFDFLAGTWSGDVKLNSTWNFVSTNELFSVMLHEAGHVFGLEHSEDLASALYEVFHSLGGLSADDIAHFQELYGVREADSFDATRLNNEMSDASALAGGDAEGDLTTLDDVDWYRFSPAANSDEVTVRLETAGLSLLTARITVYDWQGNVLGCDVACSPLDGDLEVSFSRHRGAAPYYIKVEKAANDVFGIGSYRLRIDTDCDDHENGNSDHTNNGSNGNNGNGPQDHNDSINSATNLLSKINRADPRFDYTVSVSLSAGGDVDFFRFQSPSKKEGSNFVLTGIAWNTQTGGAAPLLTFFDANGNPLDADLLTNEDGTFAIQFKDALPTSHFFVAVQAQSAEGGEYFLGLDFGDRAVDLVPLVSQVTFTSQQELGTLHVSQSQLFHYVIDATASPAGTQAWNLSVLDRDGNVVEQFDVVPGSAFSATFYLTQGDYRFLLTPAAAGQSLTLSLRAIGLTDPIGPEAPDSTLAPIGTSPNSNFAAWWELGFSGLIPKPTTPPGTGPGGTTGSPPGTGSGTGSPGPGGVAGSPTGGGGTTGSSGIGNTTQGVGSSAAEGRAFASILSGQAPSPLLGSVASSPQARSFALGGNVPSALSSQQASPLPRSDAEQSDIPVESAPVESAGSEAEAARNDGVVPEQGVAVEDEGGVAEPGSEHVMAIPVAVAGQNEDRHEVAAEVAMLPASEVRRGPVDIVLFSVIALAAIYGLNAFDKSGSRETLDR